MLMGRLQQLVEGGGELFRAEAELAGRRLRTALVGSALTLGSFLVVGLGALGALAGLTILIAERWGWPEALGAVGAAIMVVGLGLWALASLRSGRESRTLEREVAAVRTQESSPREEAEDAKEKMKDAVTPGQTKQEEKAAGTSGIDDLKGAAMAFAAKNPMAVGSVALLVVSALGVGRSVRLLSRAAAAAGFAATIIDAMGGENAGESSSKQRSPGSPGQPHGGSASQSRAGPGREMRKTNARWDVARHAEPTARPHSAAEWDGPFQY